MKLTAGWVKYGQGFAQGQYTRVCVATISGTPIPTQYDVKNRWPDNSIKFAVITCKPTLSGDYQYLNQDCNPPPKELAKRPTISVNGVPTTLTLVDTWLDGSMVKESKYEGLSNGLKIEVHFREFSDGDSSFDVVVGNTLDTVASPLGPKTYDFKIQRGADTLFEQKAINQSLFTRFVRRFKFGTFGTAVPDKGHLPKYLSLVEPAASDPVVNYPILSNGGCMVDMTSPGAHPELAYNPNWTANAIVNDQTNAMFANADCALSWPVHVDSYNTKDNPNFWLDPRGDVGQRPIGNMNCPLKLDVAHLPSLVYVPYLMTGDRIYMDELRHWANWVLLNTQQKAGANQNQRGGAQGLLWRGQPQVRGIGWGLRAIGEAAACMPDGLWWKDYFTTVVRNNLVCFDAYTGEGPLRSQWESKRTDITAGQKVVALWEHDYLAWAIWHTKQILGITDVGETHLRRIIEFNLALGDANIANIGPYKLLLAVPTSATNTTPRWFTSWAEVVANNVASTQLAGYYGPETRVLLLIARALGYNVTSKLAYVENEVITKLLNYGKCDLKLRPGWALEVP